MTPVQTPPGFIINLVTLGIVRARWITTTNRTFGRRSSFLFAWLLQPFANFGLAKRMNAALASLGSGHRESPFWCFWLTGWPLIGANRRMRRGTARLNEAISVRHAAPVR